MKAIILERRGRLCAVLREDGTIETVEHEGAVGETIEISAVITKLPLRKRKWFKSVAAAVMAVVILGGSYVYLTVPASAYVSLDVGETSMEISINRLGRVVAVDALNEDSEELSDMISDEIMNKKMEDSLDTAMRTLESEGRFDEEDSYIIVGVTSDEPKRSERISAAAESSMEALDSRVTVYMTELSGEERGRARAERQSPGRYGFERDGMKPPHEAGINTPLTPAGGQETQNTQPAQNTQASQNTHAPQNTHVPQNTQAPQNTQVPQNTQAQQEEEPVWTEQIPQNEQPRSDGSNMQTPQGGQPMQGGQIQPPQGAGETPGVPPPEMQMQE